jgi:maleamate amidohydrolase
MHYALLIIDMQKLWINEKKQMYPSTSIAIQNIQKLRQAFNLKGFPIYHVVLEHKSDASDMCRGEKLFNVRGSDEAKIIDDLTPLNSEHVVSKTRLSAFFGTDLLEQLKAQKVQSVVVTGLELRACVMATYIDAYQYDFKSAIVADAVLDSSQPYIECFLKSFSERDFLISTDSCINQLHEQNKIDC